MVMRLGMACGLMMMSGTMPSAVHCSRAHDTLATLLSLQIRPRADASRSCASADTTCVQSILEKWSGASILWYYYLAKPRHMHGANTRKHDDNDQAVVELTGRSSCVYVMPMVPFWPWRLANLSPTCGMRIDRTCAEST